MRASQRTIREIEARQSPMKTHHPSNAELELPLYISQLLPAKAKMLSVKAPTSGAPSPNLLAHAIRLCAAKREMTPLPNSAQKAAQNRARPARLRIARAPAPSAGAVPNGDPPR